MVENLNVTDIPQTPENIMLGIGLIFGIGIFALIIWTAYKLIMWGKQNGIKR